MANEVIDLAQMMGRRDTAGLYQAGTAVWQAFHEDVPEARVSAERALRLCNQRDVVYGAAFALALIGDTNRSQFLGNDLEHLWTTQQPYVPFYQQAA